LSKRQLEDRAGSNSTEAYVKKLFVCIAAAAFCSTPALAADMAVKAPPPAPPAPVYSWTGFYLGVNLGYGWDDPVVTFSGNDPTSIIVTGGGGGFGAVGGTCVPPTSFNINGPLGGLLGSRDPAAQILVWLTSLRLSRLART
jgi:hypothetical protein